MRLTDIASSAPSAMLATLLLACIAPALATEPASNGSEMGASNAALFQAENEAAMVRMMSAMHIEPTGDIDTDFAAMMIPHHQGAIDMAVAELRYGKNEQLRRIAQEIIVEQQQEIAAMRLALGQPLPSSVPAPTQPGAWSPIPPTLQSRHEHVVPTQSDADVRPTPALKDPPR